MGNVNGDRRTANSSDSSTAEPVAVRRRLGLDGSCTGSETRRSSVTEAAGTFNAGCDELLGNNSLSVGSGYVKNAGVPKVSDGEERIILQSKVSATPVEQHPEDVSESSEGCKRCGRDETSERETSGTSGNSGIEASQNSLTDSSSSDTEPRSLLTSFGGSTYSLIKLDLAYEKASKALDEEKKRANSVLTVIDDNMSKISQLTFRFYNVATVPLPELVGGLDNPDFRRSCVFTDGFHERLEVVKAYVRGVPTEAEVHENKSPVIQPLSEETAPDSETPFDDSSSDENQRTRVSRRHIFLNYSVRRAYNSVRKSRNGVVRQRKVMSKLCAVAQRLVSKAEISCRLIVYCLKTIVVELTQAVEAGMVLEAVVRTLEGNAQNVAQLRSAASSAARWASEALLDAERAIGLHQDASDSLQTASWDLDVMKGYQPLGARVLRDITAAGDRYLDVVRQSDASLSKIRDLESNLRTMRRLLTPDLVTMRKFHILINQWTAVCTETLPIVLEMLSLVTQSSCNAVDVATKAVEDILIPANISLHDVLLQNGTLQ